MSFIIPMLVEAYLSDGIDAETKRVPRTAPDYSAALYHSFLGCRNTPMPIDDKMPPLKRGVHLHFILPDAFKKAGEGGAFPAVPDRYLVTRFQIGRKKIEKRQWLVESNFISREEAYKGSVVIPAMEEEGTEKYYYCGRSYPVDETPLQNGKYLEKLTAIGAGDPMFAAYYPSCHSIFGFRDDMEGVEEGAKISYFVTGYFSKEEQDPFSGIKTQEEFTRFLQESRLSVNEDSKTDTGQDSVILEVSSSVPKEQNMKTLLFGTVEGIVWTNGTIVDKIPTGNIDVAIGKTSAEALSAVVEKTLGYSEESFQHFFTALQYKEAERIEELDGIFRIDDEIMLRQFERQSGMEGTYRFTGSDEKNSSQAAIFANVINKQSALAETVHNQVSEREKLYCLWEQYMLLYENDDSPKEPSKEAMLQEIDKVALKILEEEKNINKLRAELEKCITSIMEPTAEISYYLPKEPAMLLCGDGIKRSYAFGENGRFQQDGTLLCQLKCIECDKETEDILKQFTGNISGFVEEEKELTVQAALIIGETRKELERIYGTLTVKGEISPLAVNKEPGGFVSLFMDWKMLFYPLRTSQDTEPDNTLEHCFFSYQDTEFVNEEELPSRYITYTGRNVLTPHATKNLERRCLEWLESHEEDEEIKKAVEILHTLPIISQNMGGMNSQLAAKMQAYQFPIMGNGGDEKQEAWVKQLALERRESVLTSYPLLPLRGGYFRLSRIQIVGTYGQIQQIYVPDATVPEMPDTIYADGVKSHIPGFGYLSPGFIVPSRMNFRWLWEEGKYSSETAETSPVEGFLVPEMLNRHLWIYKKEGEALGKVKLVRRNGNWEVRWNSAPGLDKDFEKVEMSAILKKFLKVLLTQKQAFEELMKLLEVILEKTQPEASGVIVWGRPLALAKAEVSLEFLGQPEFTKGFSEFGKYNTLGIEKIKIPLALGDAKRVTDGFVGAFLNSDFSYMYPPFGVEGKDNSGYIKYGEYPLIAREDGKKQIFLLAEAAAYITLQTGMHPVSQKELFPIHREAARGLKLIADFNAVITPEGVARLPFAGKWKTGEEEKLIYRILQQEETEEWEVKEPEAVIGEAVICDGCVSFISEKERKLSCAEVLM